MLDFGTFYLDGIPAYPQPTRIRLQSPVEFSEPVPIYTSENIPGRNGNIIFETGAYANRTGTASCYVFKPNDAIILINAVNKFLFKKSGYRILTTSDDPDHYWLARVKNGARIEQKLLTLAPFEIEFDCKPQRFLKDGNDVIAMAAGRRLNNPYGFPALPIIKVFGSGSGDLTINGKVVAIKEIGNGITLDSETQNAYNGAENKNNAINAPEFPVLIPGYSDISWTGGIERIEITPRWWEL